MQLLEYLWWLLGCCYAVSRVLRLVARVPGMVARVLHRQAVVRVFWVVARRLLGYLWWFLECCYVVARVLFGF